MTLGLDLYHRHVEQGATMLALAREAVVQFISDPAHIHTKGACHGIRS